MSTKATPGGDTTSLPPYPAELESRLLAFVVKGWTIGRDTRRPCVLHEASGDSLDFDRIRTMTLEGALVRASHPKPT